MREVVDRLRASRSETERKLEAKQKQLDEVAVRVETLPRFVEAAIGNEVATRARAGAR